MTSGIENRLILVDTIAP